MRPATKTGEDQPLPGGSTRQEIPEALLHICGTFFAVEWPSPAGPRNCGQSPALAVAQEDSTNPNRISKLWE